METDLTAEQQSRVDNGRCPDCSDGYLLEGPCGGMCMNVKCDTCDAKLNLTPFGVDRLDMGNPDLRVEFPPEKKPVLAGLTVFARIRGCLPERRVVIIVTAIWVMVAGMILLAL